LTEIGALGALIRSLSRKEERKNKDKALEHLGFVGLADKADEPAGSLSYGQQKLLSLACCLALDAKLSLLEKLRDGGLTIFFIEHNIDAVMDVSDRLIVMDEGRIIADDIPLKVMMQPAVIEAYLS
jgi:ABC-type branched-subunit amino acid transport system ATPase component